MQELKSIAKRKNNESPIYEKSLVTFSKKITIMNDTVSLNTMIKTDKKTYCEFAESVIQR